MPAFAFRIDVGHILTAVAFIVATAVGWGRLEAELAQVAKSVEEVRSNQTQMWQEFRTLRDSVVRDGTRLDDFMQQDGSKRRQ